MDEDISKMKKILVIGSPGSGKSFFSAKLSELLKIPLYHLDLIYHRPDRTVIERELFDEKLDEIMKSEMWIIDGNYQRTMEKRLQCCDTVFLLDLDENICIASILDRMGKKRDDMPWVEESVDEEFMEFVRQFPEKNLPMIHALLERYREGKQIIIFRERDEVNKWIETAKRQKKD